MTSRRADALHIFVLSAFAVAQPLFDLLGRGASFFAAHRSGARDVIVLTLIAVLLVPGLLVVVRLIVSAISARAGRIFHLLCVAGLVALTVLGALPLAAIVSIPVALAPGAGFALAYRRWAGLRRFVTIASPAVVVFPVLFLFFSQARQVVLPRDVGTAAVNSDDANDTPVVMVLLDELGLTNIVTPSGEIDARRYPNLARLAEASTWYPNATTVALRTDQAVPAVLTGTRTAKRDVPTSFVYPDNVFTLLGGSHDIDAREFVSQICPSSLCPDSGRGTSGLRPMLTDATIVYLHIALPPDLGERWLPPLGDRWAGFNAADDDGEVNPQDTGGGDPVRAWLRSALVDRREQHEGDQFAKFVEGLKSRRGRPRFSYMHAQLPHPPWRYLPDGRTYPTGGTTPGYRNFEWSEDQYLANLTLQRSLLQTVYADRLIGDMLDGLDEGELFEDALVIVTSDHGATWDAGGTRREIGRGRAAQLISVPLFVKYPQQQRGRVDRRNAETIDIVPTIADVAGLDIPWHVDGVTLRGEARKGKRIFDGNRIRPIEVSYADVRERAAALKDLFNDDLYAFGPHRTLMGTRPAGDRVDVTYDRDLYADVDADGRSAPAFFRGRLTDEAPAGRPVAVTLNGRVAGVGQTYVEDGATRLAVMLDPKYLKDGRNIVDVRWIG